jgi:hypothetical protein
MCEKMRTFNIELTPYAILKQSDKPWLKFELSYISYDLQKYCYTHPDISKLKEQIKTRRYGELGKCFLCKEKKSDLQNHHLVPNLEIANNFFFRITEGCVVPLCHNCHNSSFLHHLDDNDVCEAIKIREEMDIYIKEIKKLIEEINNSALIKIKDLSLLKSFVEKFVDSAIKQELSIANEMFNIITNSIPQKETHNEKQLHQ